MQALECPPQRLARRSHNRSVESVAHRQRHGVVTSLQENFRGLLDSFARAANHRLAVAVDIRDHHVALHCLEDSLDFSQRRKNSRHLAVVFPRHLRHFTASRADGFQCVREWQSASGNQRPVFPEAVPHGHVGLDAISGQEPREREIGGEHCRLSDSGLAQIFFCLCDGVRVGVIDENEIAQRFSQQRRHDAIRFRKCFRHDRFSGAESLQHVDVL